MAAKTHTYDVALAWTGAGTEGTRSYRSYSRAYTLDRDGKPTIEGSADPGFVGDPARWNPEDMLVGSLSACHALSYLYLCSANKVVVTAYEDAAVGTMEDDGRGGGRFTRVVLRPKVTIAAGSDPETARRLHHDASTSCFIARSVNFPVEHEPEIIAGS